MKAIFKIHHKALPWHYSTYRIIVIIISLLHMQSASSKHRRKFKIIDFRRLFNLCKSNFFFFVLFYSLLFGTNCLCHPFLPHRAKPQNRVEREQNQIKAIAENKNNSKRMKIIVTVQKQSKKKFAFVYVYFFYIFFLATHKKKAFLSKVHLKVFFLYSALFLCVER